VQRVDTPRLGSVVGVSFAMTALLVMGVLQLAASNSYEDWGGVLVGLVLILISLPILSRQAARENDRSLYWLLVFALLVKVFGALIRQYFIFDVYGGVADARGYHNAGVEIAALFRSGDFNTGLQSLSSTDFIKFFTGIVYTFIGPTLLGGFLVYSWLSFMGLFLLYRAVVLAVPEAQSRTYARLIFFLPSLIFWPSSIGKDAWMVFALGIAAFGAARVLTGSHGRGLLILLLGIGLASLVRPHIAGMVSIGLAIAYIVKRPNPELRQAALVAKFVALAGLTVIALFLAVYAEGFLEGKGIDTDAGFVSGLEKTAERTGKGGSEFTPTPLRSPASAPVAIATVLFRPFLTEAHNWPTVMAALETTFLLLLALVRIRWLLAAVRSLRRSPYLVLALVYAAMFVFAFSGIANFGILVRQRVQLWPFLLVLFCIPPQQRLKRGDRRSFRAR
jgi:hypothetical protein